MTTEKTYAARALAQDGTAAGLIPETARRIGASMSRRTTPLMKALAFACCAALSLLALAPRTMAQDTTSELKHIMVPTATGDQLVKLSALHIQWGIPYPSVVKLSGAVEIRTPVCLSVGQAGTKVCDGYMVLHADEAQFHEDTGKIEAHGNVVVTPLIHETAK